MYEISSLKNPLIKEFHKLQEKSKYRKEQGKFVFEGKQELEFALQSNYEIETLLYCKNETNILDIKNDVQCISVSPQVLESLVYRKGENNIAVICKTIPNELPKTVKNGFFIIAENVEKPGNIGAIIRTANAFGAEGVILSNPLCDLYNPNVIRNSVGTFFNTNVYESNTEDLIAWLKEMQIETYITNMHKKAVTLTNLQIKFPCAWVLGTEHNGVSPIWTNNDFINCTIPMLGKVDSLNVSNAAAVILYENMKQHSLLK